jgi:hypothetical protein
VERRFESAWYQQLSSQNVAYIYNTLSLGDEVLVTMVDADVKTDGPVKVNGEAVEVRSRNSVWFSIKCNN